LNSIDSGYFDLLRARRKICCNYLTYIFLGVAKVGEGRITETRPSYYTILLKKKKSSCRLKRNSLDKGNLARKTSTDKFPLSEFQYNKAGRVLLITTPGEVLILMK
jgi:hypothetical protein